jgi:copper transport protein
VLTHLRRGGVLTGLVLSVLVATAGPAFAHASLAGTEPAPGAVLERSPAAIELRFTEPVSVARDGVRVYDAGGDPVATDPPQKAAGDVVRVGLRGRLAEGSYVVTWRVTSADTHPVQGAFTFQVGATANATSREIDSLRDRLLAERGGAQGIGAAWALTRWLAFAGIALLVGGVFFGVVVWTGARDLRATRRIVAVSWVVLTVATLVGVVLKGPYDAGLGLGDAFDPSLWRDSADTRFGVVWLARLGLLLVAFLLLRWWFAHRPAAEFPPPGWWSVAAALVGLGIVATPALAGHSAAGDHVLLTQVSSTVHVAAMSIWLGGLVMMGATVVRGPDIDARTSVVRRFSRLAMWCVLALVATGAFQTWRDVRSLDGLRDTDFGRILVIKLVVFAVMALFAVFSRDLVHRLYLRRTVVEVAAVPVAAGGAGVDRAEGDDGLDEEERGREWRNLRRSVWTEAALGLVVLAVTAALVNATPAASAAGSSGGAAGVTMRSPRVVVDVTVTPAVAGLNDVHVSTYSRAGAPVDVPELSVTMDQPSRDIAPIVVPLRKLGPGHYLSPGFDLPLSGDWRVAARVRLTEVDLVTLTGTIPID